jgi:hypothetical protein
VPEREKKGRKQRQSNPVCSTTKLSWLRMSTGESLQRPEFLYLLGTVLYVSERLPGPGIPASESSIAFSSPRFWCCRHGRPCIPALRLHRQEVEEADSSQIGIIQWQPRNVNDRVLALGTLRQLQTHSKAMELQEFQCFKWAHLAWSKRTKKSRVSRTVLGYGRTTSPGL